MNKFEIFFKFIDKKFVDEDIICKLEINSIIYEYLMSIIFN